MAQGIKDKVAILGMGCSKFGERWDAGAEELIVEAFDESACGCRHRHERDRGGLAFHGDGFRQRRAQRPAAQRIPAPAEHRRDPCRELLRLRVGGLSRRGLCGGFGSGGHRAGARRRKAQGHRLRRASRRQRRHPVAALDGDRLGAREFRAACQRLPGQARRRQGRPQARHRPRFRQEPRQRHQEPQGAPQAGDHGGRRHQRAHDRRNRWVSSTAAA